MVQEESFRLRSIGVIKSALKLTNTKKPQEFNDGLDIKIISFGGRLHREEKR